MQRSRMISALAALAMTLPVGCSMLMRNAMTPTVTDEAVNPLVSGAPLIKTSKSALGTSREEHCETWPFEDNVTVTVSDAEVCVEINRNVANVIGSMALNNPESKTFYVKTDATRATPMDLTRTREAKISKCYEPGYAKDMAIWNVVYQGCMPNGGMLTAASTFFEIDDIRWGFAAPAAEATAAR